MFLFFIICRLNRFSKKYNKRLGTKKTMNWPRVQQQTFVARVNVVANELLQIWPLRPSCEHHFLPLGGEKWLTRQWGMRDIVIFSTMSSISKKILSTLLHSQQNKWEKLFILFHNCWNKLISLTKTNSLDRFVVYEAQHRRRQNSYIKQQIKNTEWLGSTRKLPSFGSVYKFYKHFI